MKVAIVGATGMIGRRLTSVLRGGGYEVLAISRRGQSVADAPGLAWDPAAGPLDPAALAGVDAVVNLAGASIGSGRWSDARKREIADSRIVTTQRLVEAIGTDGPRTLINSSAVGYYGEGTTPVDEHAPAADDFLGRTCAAWEAAATAAEANGVRVVVLRTGVVIARESEVLRRQLPAFKLGLGGPVGGGEQWWSWIHIDDVTGLIVFALTHPELHGPVNAVAPQAVRQKDFAARTRAGHRAPDGAPDAGIRPEAGDGRGIVDRPQRPARDPGGWQPPPGTALPTRHRGALRAEVGSARQGRRLVRVAEGALELDLELEPELADVLGRHEVLRARQRLVPAGCCPARRSRGHPRSAADTRR